MQHKLVLARRTDEFVEWECPECQRYIRLGINGSGFKVLNPGDQMANHGAASITPGLNLTTASVAPMPDLH